MTAIRNPFMDLPLEANNISKNPFMDLPIAQPENNIISALKKQKGTGYTGEILQALPGMMQGITDPREAIKQRIIALGRGLSEAGYGVKQTGLRIGEGLGLISPGQADEYTKAKDIETQQYQQSPTGQNPYNEILRTIGQQAPVMAATAPIAGSVGLLNPEILQRFPNLAQIGTAGGIGALSGGVQYAPEGESKIANAATSGLLGAGIAAMPAAVNAVRPTSLISRFANPTLSNEELLRNLEATAGTETGLGDVIESPMLKRIQENILTKVPFTGGNPTLQRTGAEIVNRANNIVQGFRQDIPHEAVSEELGNRLIQAKEAGTQLKDQLYRGFHQKAEELGVGAKPTKFASLARKYLKDIENTNILQFEPETKSLISRLSNYKQPVKTVVDQSMILDQAGQPIVKSVEEKLPSLQEANILQAKLREISNKYATSPSVSDRNAAKVFGNLAKALKNDVRDSVKNSGSKELQNLFKTAETNYRNNYSGFLDKDLLKFTSGNKSADDLVSTFLKTSNTADKADQLDKLMSKLDPETQDLVRYSYFSRAMEGPEDMRTVNPNKLKTLWNKLGTKQKQILIPDEAQRRQLDNFSILTSKNQKAINMMFNPATGQMNLDVVTAIMMQNPLGFAKDIALGRGANYLLTNEPTRESVVQEILRRRGG